MGYRVEKLKNNANKKKCNRKKLYLFFIILLCLVICINIVDKANTALMGLDISVFSYNYDNDNLTFQIMGNNYKINNEIIEYIDNLKDKLIDNINKFINKN